MEEGDIVDVLTADGDFAAVGMFHNGTIAVRVLSFENVAIDAAFWTQRFAEALSVRRNLGLLRPDNDSFRLVHGEGDGMPGLVVDIYGDTAVMQAHSVGMHRVRNQLCAALLSVLESTVKNVYYKSETTIPNASELNLQAAYIHGGDSAGIGMENGLRFNIDWLKGQKTGFFLDQRDNRSLLEHFSRGHSVLNMFCYTGGFSVYAMRGGAVTVHSVDSSERAVSLTRANVQLNFAADARHEAFCADAFRFLDRPKAVAASALERYDVVLLDPPAFAKHRGALHNALKGYIRLNAAGLRRVSGGGGVMFTFSCSQIVTKDHFRNAVFTAAAQAGRRVRILHQLHQAPDHPINIYHPEGEYLKGLVLYVE